jgi:ligand-binding sensor domain-containing protein
MTRFYKAFFFFLILPLVLYPQSQNIKFEHISVEQGLSSAYVKCILQDSIGFMWFGTADGLNKYDGYTFTIFRNDPNDTLSLSDSQIRIIHEDPSGILWIGTGGGGGIQSI